MRYRQKTRGRLEHRLLMEALLGRPLLDSEVVHHKNLDKLDNRPENLVVMSRGEHSRLHNHLRIHSVAQVAEMEDGRFSRYLCKEEAHVK